MTEHQLICQKCSKRFPSTEVRWKCECGSLLDIELQAKFDLDAIFNCPPTMWRYREALPVDDGCNIVSFQEGFTPLTDLKCKGRSVFVKHDHLFSTGSYKDRGASVLISKAKELGVENVVEDSSGNAGCAIAAYCARAGIGCEIFVPAQTSPAKLAQIELYGARLTRVPGSREDTARAVLAAAENHYYASHSWNPYFFHGTKTFAYEVCEQLGWKAPDTVIIPVGNGTLLLGCEIGFNDMLRAGIIEHLPKLIGVQSSACAPLQRAFDGGLDGLPKVETTSTLAEGIAIAEPVRGMQIIEAVRQSGGKFVAVDEGEVRQVLLAMCQQGHYIEPTSAATIAGVEKYLDETEEDGTIVTVFTGHGLKSTEKMLDLASG